MPREVRYCRPRTQPTENLLNHLSFKFTYLSEAEWRHHIHEGHVLVNGRTATDGDYVLQQGDMLRFAPPRSLEPHVDEENISILYNDDALVVCAKNGNLPVAEGGRYCENTLIAVLQRKGIQSFFTASTIFAGAGTEFSDALHGRADVSSAIEANCGRKTSPDPQTGSHAQEDTVVHGVKGKRSRDATPPSRPLEQSKPAAPTLFTVQRLDKETSGVLVLCKDSGAAKAVAGQLEAQTRACTAAVEARVATLQSPFTNEEFDAILHSADKTVRKTYTAVVLGAAPVDQSFVVVNYMGAMHNHPTFSADPQHAQLKKLKMCCEPLTSRLVVSTQDENAKGGETVIGASASAAAPGTKHSRSSAWGKVACTRVRVLASSPNLHLSCVEVELLTGRSHQIRVHCASIGFPVVGDKLYYSETPGDDSGGCAAVSDALYLSRVRNEEDPFVCVENGARDGRRVWCRRHLLHATELQFEHPQQRWHGAKAFVVSPVESFMRDVRFEAVEDKEAFHALLLQAFSKYNE